MYKEILIKETSNSGLNTRYGIWNSYEKSEKKEKNAIPNVTRRKV